MRAAPLRVDAILARMLCHRQPSSSVLLACPRGLGGSREQPGQVHSCSGCTSGNLHSSRMRVCSRRVLAMLPIHPRHLCHHGLLLLLAGSPGSAVSEATSGNADYDVASVCSAEVSLATPFAHFLFSWITPSISLSASSHGQTSNEKFRDELKEG